MIKRYKNHIFFTIRQKSRFVRYNIDIKKHRFCELPLLEALFKKVFLFLLKFRQVMMEVFIMPKISTFMYSEGAVNETVPNGQRLHIVAPLLIFTPMFIPGTFSFSVALGILGIDVDKDHIFQFKFKTPVTGEAPLIDTGEINFPRISDSSIYDLPLDMRGIMLNFGFQNVVFRNEGTYISEVFLDGESLGEFPIDVKGKERLQ